MCYLLCVPVLEAGNYTNYFFRWSLLLSSLYFSMTLVCVFAKQRIPDASLEADDCLPTMKKLKLGPA